MPNYPLELAGAYILARQRRIANNDQELLALVGELMDESPTAEVQITPYNPEEPHAAVSTLKALQEGRKSQPALILVNPPTAPIADELAKYLPKKKDDKNS